MITILLATYNGSKWLGEFLDSVAAQTIPHWRMLIRDDGSSDATLDIVRAAARRDNRLVLVTDHFGRLGATGSFGQLMQHAAQEAAGSTQDAVGSKQDAVGSRQEARYAASASDCGRYFAFADQDDVWLPGKLQRQLEAMQELESQRGCHVPLLVHSDLVVVDRELRIVHRSHTALARLARRCPPSRALPTLLAHNFVTGCATLINRPLLEAATPLPPGAALHDWWVACCAAALGYIHYLDEPLVLYRQHGKNQVGAGRRILSLRHLLRARRTISRGATQAVSLRQRLCDLGIGNHHPTARLVDAYAQLFATPASAWRRFWCTYRLQVGRPGRAWRLLNAIQAATVKNS